MTDAERGCRSGAFSARPFAMGRRFVMRLSVEKRWLPEIVEEPSGFLSDCGIERLAGVAVPETSHLPQPKPHRTA